MSDKVIATVSREDLYHYCAEARMLLSWGLPMTKMLLEIEASVTNPFLRQVTYHLMDSFMHGISMSEFFRRYPSVFKPVAVSWIEIGEKYGVLDDILFILAGMYRLDDLMVPKRSAVKPEILGEFLVALANRVKKNSSDFIHDLADNPMEYTSDPVLLQWIQVSTGAAGEGNLFDNSLQNLLTVPLYRTIASALFWHTLERAEKAGYLGEQLEILGMYLKDNSLLLPSPEPVEIETHLKDGRKPAFTNGKSILLAAAQSDSKKMIITVFENKFTYVLDSMERSLGKLLNVSDNDVVTLQSAISSVKLIVDADMVEKRLPQTVETTAILENRKYRIRCEISPPYPMKGTTPRPEELLEPALPEVIKLTVKALESSEPVFNTTGDNQEK